MHVESRPRTTPSLRPGTPVPVFSVLKLKVNNNEESRFKREFITFIVKYKPLYKIHLNILETR